MHARVALDRSPSPAALLDIDADATASISDLAQALSPWTNTPAAAPTVVAGGHALNPSLPITSSGIHSGSTLALSSCPAADAPPPSAMLSILTGPRAGTEVPLPSGRITLGDDTDTIDLKDPLAAARSAVLSIGTESAAIRSTGDAAIILLNGEHTDKTLIHPTDTIRVGATDITITPIGDGAGIPVTPTALLHPAIADDARALPQAPTPGLLTPFPIIMMLLPLGLGLTMFAITRSPFSLMIIVFMPAFALGGYLTARRAHRLQRTAAWRRFDDALLALRRRLRRQQIDEHRIHAARHPHIGDVCAAAIRRDALVFSRAGHSPDAGAVRIGLAAQPAAAAVSAPSAASDPATGDQLERAAETLSTSISPAVLHLTASEPVALTGRRRTQQLLHSMVLQLCTLHSPADLTLCVLGGEHPDWLLWLPHAHTPFSPLRTAQLIRDLSDAAPLLADLLRCMDERTAAAAQDRTSAGPSGPTIVLLLLEPERLEPPVLRTLLSAGPRVGIHPIPVCSDQRSVPQQCATILTVPEHGPAELRSDQRTQAVLIETETASDALIARAARSLAPLVDATVSTPITTRMPSRFMLTETASGTADSLLARAAAAWADPRPNLAAAVGHTGTSLLELDLAADGPHALVGGTTGSGKSEFLRSWVLAIAAQQPPTTTTFLFVDYKGGSAFADCTRLPHCVGLVTDLDDHLVHRVLTSLRAELRRREAILADAGTPDLDALRSLMGASAFPRLIIVVDEFAALTTDVPEFVDGVIDIAARGRSLGLHLILATQRPAGVITGAIRANTALRVALRCADPADSTDIIGTPAAAHFPPEQPGRAALSSGPGRITDFQSAFAGASSSARSALSVTVRPVRAQDRPEVSAAAEHAFVNALQSTAAAGDAPADTRTDAAQIVDGLRALADQRGIPAPRRPWLDPLPSVLTADDALTFLPAQLGRSHSRACIGVIDDPRRQRRHPLEIDLGTGGITTVIGAPGAGTTSALITAAQRIAAAVPAARIWGIDATGTGSLASLLALPAVQDIIATEDTARMTRLMDRLIADARDDHGGPLRGVLLIDGGSALKELLLQPRHEHWAACLAELTAAARQCGIRIIAAADHHLAVPTVLTRAAAATIVLRQSSREDAAQLGVPRGLLTDETPPGRGAVDGQELQLIAPDPLPADLGRPAEVIRTLPAVIRADALPAHPTKTRIGLHARTLKPLTRSLPPTMLVAGPAGSGRREVLASLASEFRRLHPGAPVFQLSADPATTVIDADEHAAGEEELIEFAAELHAWTGSHPERRAALVILTGVRELVGRTADLRCAEALRRALATGMSVIGELDTSSRASGSQLTALLLTHGSGILLDADPSSSVFGSRRTAFPDEPGPYRGFAITPTSTEPILAAAHHTEEIS